VSARETARDNEWVKERERGREREREKEGQMEGGGVGGREWDLVIQKSLVV